MPRFVIVEDEPLIALTLQDWLLELGCDVVGTASTVAGALELIKEEKPEACILDHKLGNENSREVADALAALGIPTIHASGWAAEQVSATGNGGLVLTKPYDFDAVRVVVEKLGLS